MATETLPPALLTLLDHRREIAFMVDFDGTMVDFAAHPDAVEVPPALAESLGAIAAMPDIAFAIVTGRALANLDQLTQSPGTVAIGSHGAEWRPCPGGARQALAAVMPEALRAALAAVGVRHGCLIEDKAYTLSLHLPYAKRDRDLTGELTMACGYQLRNCDIRKAGERTWEVRRKAISKGSAIRHLLRRAPFAGRHPVYIGDDAHSDISLRALGILLATPQEGAGGSDRAADLEIADVGRFLAMLARG